MGQDFARGVRPTRAMLMETEDELLAQAAAAGDRAAFGTLVARHYDRIFALAWRLTGVRAEAEDLAQDICAALPTRLRGWRGDSRFTTWLYRVVVNATHDRRRRAAVRMRASTGWGDWETGRQADIAAEAAGRAWLSAAMAALPADLRDTVALMVDDGMTQGQAALVLGVAEGTVAWRMSEVKRRLKAIAAQEAQG